ncbi:hypothetical protein ZHAS_00011017 [Anopheles sinensis]|uniref:Uncharacterized protein n=1 Tax=Anopheles sinensis TaxID=74873 RepID=A0A084VZ45_ANOSI|nr:hypothetical protein ZHAS_00011017 [Anopheles sinensis]
MSVSGPLKQNRKFENRKTESPLTRGRSFAAILAGVVSSRQIYFIQFLSSFPGFERRSFRVTDGISCSPQTDNLNRGPEQVPGNIFPHHVRAIGTKFLEHLQQQAKEESRSQLGKWMDAKM